MDFRKRLLKKSEVVEEQNLYSYVEFNEYYNSVITQRELYENYLAKNVGYQKNSIYT
jgi:hypothetical protein